MLPRVKIGHTQKVIQSHGYRIPIDDLYCNNVFISNRIYKIGYDHII